MTVILPTSKYEFFRIVIISASRFCRSDWTFSSIWRINPCSCKFSSALRAARLSACFDRRRLCDCCSAIMSRLRERSIVVVVVDSGFSFLPKIPRNPFRFGFLGCSCTLFCTITGTWRASFSLRACCSSSNLTMPRICCSLSSRIWRTLSIRSDG